jgi:tetratricopeptide (TPR) repeat protein
VFARAAENDATILAVLEDAILYPIDCEKGEGIELAKRFKVRGYPTFKMVNSQAEELECWIGYEGPEKWAQAAQAGVADQRTLVEKAAAFETEPTLVLARSLGNAAATKYDFKQAVSYFRQARDMAGNPMAGAEYTEGVLTNMYYGARNGDFTFEEVDVEAKMVVDMPMAPLDARMNVSAMMVSLAGVTNARWKAIPYLEKAMAMSEGSTDEGVLAIRKGMAVDHALQVEKDSDKAVALKRASMDEGWQEDAGQLNEFAWWCFENDVNLEEAQEMALKGVQLAGSDAERANILDTAAEICHARGNCDDAIARIKEAIALDPDKEYFKNQLVRFEEAAKAKQRG